MGRCEEYEAATLEFAAVLASKATNELAERTSVTWTVTPDASCLDWALSFRCPGVSVDCITVSSNLFSGIRRHLPTDTEHGLNWITRAIVNSALAFCLQKCIHGCCRKELELPMLDEGDYRPAEIMRDAFG